ncbi:hypothetical protein [Desulfovibrio piger]|uniref:hypothetical protein n=1 Tax=Desulfovibrio piger TaxID=901 RepID=UPI00242D9D30|nr:hypothetical protein [Desulfovibrio piger]MCI6939851.1 hypothetical protein [Desulfovibrio piger]
MKTALAVLGGIFLFILILVIMLRSRTILKANKIMEDAIRRCWVEAGASTPKEQDDIALNMMRTACFSAENLNQYRLALGAIRSLSNDIVKDKYRLNEFKREFYAYGVLMGWSKNL